MLKFAFGTACRELDAILTPGDGSEHSLIITAAVANDSSSKGVTWSLSGPGSLSSTLGSQVTYAPPAPRLSSPAQATVTATSVADPTKSASLQITANPDPYLLFQTLVNGMVGVPYSQSLVLNGGTSPFQWSVYNGSVLSGSGVGGSVPDGLELNATTGTISGTPTSAGTWNFTALAVDADNESASIPISIQIEPGTAASGRPVPFLNQPLVPASVSPGISGFTLKVSGSGFVSGATIDFNGTPLATTFIDSEHLSASVPAVGVATARTVSVTAANPAPGGGSSNTIYLPVGPPQKTVSFTNAPNSPLQFFDPAGLTIADFDEDGRPDLAIAANVRLYVLLGQGDRTFASAPGSPLSMPSPPFDDLGSPYVGPLTAGDFDHSGHAGLAVGEFSNEAAVILLGKGNGTFVYSSAAFANAEGTITALENADFNADGNLDLAFSNFPGTSLVSLGYGKGAFSPAGSLDTASGGFPDGVAMGDFNGDGKLDLAMSNGGSTFYPYSGLTISLGNGDGTFVQTKDSPLTLGQNLTAIVAGDFDGDGNLDLAVTDGTANLVFILLGNGDGTFRQAASAPVGTNPASLVLADFDNDGNLDLATANSGDDTVTLLLGKGDGSFKEASGSPFAAGNGARSIAAADFNGDGKLDLAVANITDGTVSILLQH